MLLGIDGHDALDHAVQDGALLAVLAGHDLRLFVEHSVKAVQGGGEAVRLDELRQPQRLGQVSRQDALRAPAQLPDRPRDASGEPGHKPPGNRQAGHPDPQTDRAPAPQGVLDGKPRQRYPYHPDDPFAPVERKRHVQHLPPHGGAVAHLCARLPAQGRQDLGPPPVSLHRLRRPLGVADHDPVGANQGDPKTPEAPEGCGHAVGLPELQRGAELEQPVHLRRDQAGPLLQVLGPQAVQVRAKRQDGVQKRGRQGQGENREQAQGDRGRQPSRAFHGRFSPSRGVFLPGGSGGGAPSGATRGASHRR